jgi:hypothetical protein
MCGQILVKIPTVKYHENMLSRPGTRGRPYEPKDPPPPSSTFLLQMSNFLRGRTSFGNLHSHLVVEFFKKWHQLFNRVNFGVSGWNMHVKVVLVLTSWPFWAGILHFYNRHWPRSSTREVSTQIEKAFVNHASTKVSLFQCSQVQLQLGWLLNSSGMASVLWPTEPSLTYLV